MIEIINPATELTIATLPRAEISDVDAAVQRAARAYDSWSRVSPQDRARVMRRLADTVEAHAEELSEIESRNVGKPISTARGEVSMVVEIFHFCAGAIDKHYGATIPVAGGVDVTFRESLGVVGLITPWNFPLAIAAWKIAPALACGNTVVLKPAELTPLSAIRLAELARDSGIPEGVLNVVVGPGRTVGTHIAEHADIAKVAFTGSTEAGRSVMHAAAGTIKRLTLELGGKSANIVFADADLEAAAAAAPLAVFDNTGQDCCARSRILVERSCFEHFLDLFVDATRQLKVGLPEDPATQMGPLISASHRDTVSSYLPADPFFTGTAPEGPGFWFPPVIATPSKRDDRLMVEEVFGPVAAVVPFDSEEDAIELANATIYGLSGSIWTRDVGRAFRVARSVQSGVLSVNSNSSLRPSTPFGGMKQSGFGRELGMAGLDGYSELKNVFLAT